MDPRCAVLLALLAGVAGCRGVDPARFPPLAAGSDAAVLAELAARYRGFESLQGIATMAYDGPEHAGTFDAVVSWTREPRRVRMVAFKDIVLASHDVFDLVLTPERYFVEFREDEEEETTTKTGPASRFSADVPELAAFQLAGEALFLPGLGAGAPGARVLERNEQAVLVETFLPSGARAIWTLAPDTLTVRRAAVLAPDSRRRVALRYGDWIRAGEWPLPGMVRLEDPHAGTTVTIAVHDVDAGVDLGPADFDRSAP